MSIPFKQRDFFVCAYRVSASAVSGRAKQFFFIFAKEDNLVESRYRYDPTSLALERYSEEPADYESSTYQAKDVCLSDISDCKFSYSDGSTWQDSWGIDKERFPVAIKVDYRFRDEEKAREFVVNIPISP